MKIILPLNFDFIPYTINSAEFNMSLDEALFFSVKNKFRQNVFRIYGWSSPSISVGFFQKKDSINLTQCHNHNVSLVRRLTGGRAVYHHNEITFSFACAIEKKDHVHKKEIFSHFSKIIRAGLKEMGIETQVNHKTKGELNNPNCFQSTSSCEITNANGEKLVGTALLFQDDAVLVQGSIPLDKSYLNLTHYLSHNTSHIYFPNAISSPLLLITSFIKGVKSLVTLNESQCSENELLLTRQLAKEKYQNPDWNLVR